MFVLSPVMMENVLAFPETSKLVEQISSNSDNRVERGSRKIDRPGSIDSTQLPGFGNRIKKEVE